MLLLVAVAISSSEKKKETVFEFEVRTVALLGRVAGRSLVLPAKIYPGGGRRAQGVSLRLAEILCTRPVGA